MTGKKVHLKVDDKLTLQELLTKIEAYQKAHPDREVFFDGDEFAICSRPKPKK